MTVPCILFAGVATLALGEVSPASGAGVASPVSIPGKAPAGVLPPAEAAIVQTADVLRELDACLAPVKDKATADAAVPAFLVACRKLHKVLASLDEMEDISLEETERICARYDEELKTLSESSARKLASLRQADYYGSASLKDAVETFMEDLKGIFPSMG